MVSVLKPPINQWHINQRIQIGWPSRTWYMLLVAYRTYALGFNSMRLTFLVKCLERVGWDRKRQDICLWRDFIRELLHWHSIHFALQLELQLTSRYSTFLSYQCFTFVNTTTVFCFDTFQWVLATFCRLFTGLSPHNDNLMAIICRSWVLHPETGPDTHSDHIIK